MKIPKWVCAHPPTSRAYFLDIPGDGKIFSWKKNSVMTKFYDEDYLQTLGRLGYTCAHCKTDINLETLSNVGDFLEIK